MGTVRREGNWRLEKQDDGVYEVTYEKQAELKIITTDYEPTGFTDARNDLSVPSREVKSFSDAERLFEEMAQGQPSLDAFGPDIPSVDSGIQSSNDDFELAENENLPDLPPGGVFLVTVIVSGFLLQQAGLNVSSPTFVIGAAFLLVPIGILGLTYRVYQTDGAGAAIEYLVSVEDESAKTESSNETPEKTPPAPQKMKDEIYFERADQRCEWCEERTDSPEIHHIEPRAEGGSNDYENLIALCPGCHSKADKGGISKTKLKAKATRQMDNWSKPS